MGAVVEPREPTKEAVRAAVVEALEYLATRDTFGFWDLDVQVVDTGEFDVEILADQIWRRLAR